MLYYAIADLHGRFDLLKTAFVAIMDDAPIGEHYQIITLGDYIDRGPQSKEVLAMLMDQQDGSQKGSDLICLQGNHEAMAVETIIKPLDSGWWMSNGGYETILSYEPTAHYWEVSWMYPEHVKWMASLPLYYETEHHVFVHAGIPYPLLPMKAQDPEKMQWMLYSNDDHGGWLSENDVEGHREYKEKHVVHGHHQFADGPHEWSGRTDLDCHAYHTGRLVVGVYSSDKPGKALRYLEVLGDDYRKKDLS